VKRLEEVELDARRRRLDARDVDREMAELCKR